MKKLYLHNINIPHYSLTKFLRCFQSLEDLLYAPGDENISMFEPSCMMKAIEHLKPSLQKIELRTYNDYQTNPGFELDCIGSFSEFKRLKSIDMAQFCLLGRYWKTDYSEEYKPQQTLMEALPASIEKLRLTDVGNVLALPAIELLSNIGDFPWLESLDFGWYLQPPHVYSY